ncbi:MAG: hypothetical protein GYA17_01620 [Chloroflexi bacterium]|nr:hypothetical protein [Chloroflexota bacterium]
MHSLSIRTRIAASFVGALVLGAVVALLSAPAAFGPGWLAAGLLLWPALLALLSAWQWAGGGRMLAWLVALAFVLRLGGGIAFSLALPVYGYDEEVQKAGYLYYDAYMRDGDAWELASSDEPLLASFSQEITTDQYGGLLSISALVYRYLSPDAHRPFLILILGAFVYALGVPFFWQAVRRRWNLALANLAAWILVLYPDAILYSSSQMREPFLIGLACIAFWGVLAWGRQRRGAILAMAGGLALMLLISSRVAVAVFGVLAVWFWFEHLAPRSGRLRLLGWAALALGAVALLAFSWEWLRSSSQWDLLVTERSSGRVQYSLGEIGDLAGMVRIPFIVGYGLAQPVLPASIADPAIPLWKFIAIFRSAGWYLLAPFLLYSVFTVFKAPPQDRKVLLWLAGFVLVWLVVSSARAGGDQWDNPRYRTLFIPWLALLAGWGIRRALETRDFWLARWLVVEAIFLGFFTHWYFSRYFNAWARLPFWENVLWILGLSALVLASGWAWDLYRARRNRGAHPG